MNCDHQFFREPYASGVVMEACVICGERKRFTQPMPEPKINLGYRASEIAIELLRDIGVFNER